ncbi:MAG: helix-turn-helix domain-containing protein [archaeon]
MEVYSALEDFGLSKSEASIYVTLLKLGSATPSEIAQKTNIHRVSIYDILLKLQDKGIVSFAVLGKRKYYEAVKPEQLVILAEEKKKALEEIVPKLSAQMVLAKPANDATIFKDWAGIKSVLLEVTQVKGTVRTFSSGWGLPTINKNFYESWNQRLFENKVKIRFLVSKKHPQKMKSNYEIRYLPDEFSLPSTTMIFEDKVFIIIWTSNLGILIKSKDVAESYTKYFELLWNISEPQ